MELDDEITLGEYNISEAELEKYLKTGSLELRMSKKDFLKIKKTCSSSDNKANDSDISGDNNEYKITTKKPGNYPSDDILPSDISENHYGDLNYIRYMLDKYFDEYKKLMCQDHKFAKTEKYKFDLIHRKYINSDFEILIRHPDYVTEKVFSKINDDNIIKKYICSELLVILNLKISAELPVNDSAITNSAYIISRLSDKCEEKLEYIKLLISYRDYKWKNHLISKDV